VSKYLIRRLLQAIPLLFMISIILFGLINAVPGGLMTAYENRDDITPEDYARVRAKYGYDESVPVKYVKWLRNAVTGDWGTSFVSKRPVIQEIKERLPNTLLLMGAAFFLTLLIAIPLGIYSALRQYSLGDHVLTTLAFAGQSLPVFWFGLLLIIVFSVMLKNPVTGKPLLPGAGMATAGAPFDLVDRIRHLILPVIMLSVVSAAGYMRYMRSSMLEVINQDYVRTARGKGLREKTVINRHALRNALIPIVTLIALDLPYLFIGAVFTETIFAWPGMGRLFLDSAFKTDYPMLMALLMITTILIVLFNLLADVVYAFLDPRIRYE
jgi:peptide/nickel transport system permease protein